MTAEAPAFAGFWMGGYEGADHVNADGTALDMARASGHLDRLDEDHRRAAQAGLRCVRESIGWRLCEDAGGAIDLGRALCVQASARRHGLQVLWTLVHYGLPPGLSLHDDALIPRLARFAAEVARVLGGVDGRPPVFTPVNEISFLSWAASQPGLLRDNDAGEGGDPWRESSRISGYAVKRRLVRAALAAMAAMRAVRPHARFMHVEPMVHVVAPPGRPDLAPLAEQVSGWQWQAWDLIAGRSEPALGGASAWLDIVGINHYHSSQWEVDTEARLDWAARDLRRCPVHRLLAQAWQRYGRPLVLAETSHVGIGRAAWLHEMAGEVRRARQAGVPVQGLCLYPLVDRPDWQRPAQWHRSGLWHVEDADPSMPRRAEPETMAALRAWQQVLPHPLRHGLPQPVLVAFVARRGDGLPHRAAHLLARLPPHGLRVVVVEPPSVAPQARLEAIVAGPCLDRLCPTAPDATFDATLQALLADWLAGQGVQRPIAWIGTPAAWPVVRALAPACVVVDAAQGAHATARLTEADLVLVADAVQAAACHAQGATRVRVVPSGVDRVAFAAPRGRPPCGWDDHEAAQVMRCIAPLPGPRLGYAGAVDSRVDLALLAQLAEARPHWQFVIVGPVVGLAPTRLPQRPNLHWLGEQPHRLMPALMRGWAAALLPFHDGRALACAPAQVLEALAVGLPVVAPGWPGAPALRAAGVTVVGEGASAFLAACDEALDESDTHRVIRRRAARRALRHRDWRTVTAALAAELHALAAHATACA